jgi:glutamate dehydrogenase (NAD(P)+)
MVPGIITGKPLNLQGSQGRVRATGHGLAFLASRALDRFGIPVEKATAIVQGYGNVGLHTALTLASYGVAVRGVSDVTGAVWNDRGLDLRALSDHLQRTGSMVGFGGGEPIDPAAMLCQPCDILAPAACGMAITRENAPKLQCRVLAEGANGPTTPGADAILEERGDVFVIPDILGNSGGVTVSYFEWVQNLQRYHWTEREVLTRLETMLERSFLRVAQFAKTRGVSNRVAAQALAVQTVAEVKDQRGMFP